MPRPLAFARGYWGHAMVAELSRTCAWLKHEDAARVSVVYDEMREENGRMHRDRRFTFVSRIRLLLAMAVALVLACVYTVYDRHVRAPSVAALQAAKKVANERDAFELARSVEDKRRSQIERLTTRLPAVDRVELCRFANRRVALDERFAEIADAMQRTKENRFPDHVNESSLEITERRTIVGPSAEAIAKLWRECHITKVNWLCGHDPMVGVRFYVDNQVAFETSLDWMCHTFAACDGRSSLGMLEFHDQGGQLRRAVDDVFAEPVQQAER